MTQGLMLWAWRWSVPAAILETAGRAALIVGLALLAGRLLRDRSAAGRRLLWIGTMLLVAILGILGMRSAWTAADAPAWVSEDGGTGIGSAGGARILLALWLVPTALLLLRLGMSQLRLRALLAACRPLPSSIWHGDARRIGAEMGLRRPVTLLVSRRIDSPITVGLRRSALVIPEALLNASSTLRESVLWHEIAHVRRRDVAARWLAAVSCAIHWFHPLVWLAARRLRCECECASDDAVLRSGVPGSIYVRHLLALADAAPLATPGIGASDLCRRIEAIADHRDRRDLGLPARVLLTGVAAALLALVLQVGFPRPRLRLVTAGEPRVTQPGLTWESAPAGASALPQP